MYKVYIIIFSIFLICNAVVFSNEQQGQLEIGGSVSLIAQIEFFETEAFFLNLRVNKVRHYIARIHVDTNADYKVYIKSQNGGILVGSGVGNYAVPYQLFYDDLPIAFDETGTYCLFIEKEREKNHTDEVIPVKANELIISYKGNPDLPGDTYSDTLTIQIEATTSSGDFAAMRHKLHIRGFTDLQVLDTARSSF